MWKVCENVATRLAELYKMTSYYAETWWTKVNVELFINPRIAYTFFAHM